MPFLTGWTRRKSKVVNGSTAGTQLNYQMRLTINKTTGTDTVDNIFLGPNIRDNFSDLRFTDTDQITILNYWIESVSPGISAIIWINIPSIPASPSTKTIYIYYDNPIATPVSNGRNTFPILFEDFAPAWTRFSGNPILSKQGTGFESLLVYTPRILKNIDGTVYRDAQNQYWMYYAGGQFDGSTISLDQGGVAFSTDLINWTRYSGNPILPVSNISGNYDYADVVMITVMKDGPIWRAWWESNKTRAAQGSDFVTISYAESTDGLNWTKFSGNPILTQGPAGSGDVQDLYAPVVIKDGTTWKMWYTGHNASGQYRLMHATASNPQGPWTKFSNNYIFNPGRDVFPSEVWKEGTIFNMTYMDANLTQIYLATSPDGITWTDVGTLLSASGTGWDASRIYWPSQIFIDGTWYMFYNGGDTNVISSIGFATGNSRTGISSSIFTRIDPGSVLGIGNALNITNVSDVSNTYAYKDLLSDPGNIVYSFEIKRTDSNAQTGIGLGLSDTLNGIAAANWVNGVIFNLHRIGAPNFTPTNILVVKQAGNRNDAVGGIGLNLENLNVLFYTDLIRNGNTFTVQAYTDPQKTNRVIDRTITIANVTGLRYAYAFSTWGDTTTPASGTIDNTRIRRLISPEPTFGASGTEEIVTTATGTLSISSTPSGARIFIDNVDQGVNTPATITNITEGIHSYRLSLTGFLDKTGSFTIITNQTTTVTDTLTPFVGTLSISSTPSGARIFIDNIDQGVNTPATIANVSEGNHSYKLTLLNFQDRTGTFNIVANTTTTITDILTPSPGTLSISSTPSGARVFVDNIDQGLNTPATIINLSPGTHAYRLNLTNFQDRTGVFTILSNTTTTIVETLTPLTGSLSISSIPSGARIFVDNIDQGLTTPAVLTGITAGSHTYKLTFTGFSDATGTFNIVGGQTTNISATLTSSTGTLSISSTPSGARIFIDDVDLGINTPSSITNMIPGSHTYKLTLPGFQDSAATFTITAGQTTTLSITLTSLQNTGSISFSSIPIGAKIFLDNIDQNTITPILITNIAIGTHTYRLSLINFNDISGTVNVVQGQIANVANTLVPTQQGCIYFDTLPQNAKIFVDNIDTTKITPDMVCGLTPGIHTYRLELSGYQTISDIANLITGQGTTVPNTLILIGTGSLNMSSSPSGAKIFIDNVDTGVITPTTISNLQTGSHTFRLTLSGFVDSTGTFDIISNQITTLLQTLVPIATAGFGGTGLLMIAGLAIGALLLSRGKQPGLITKELE